MKEREEGRRMGGRHKGKEEEMEGGRKRGQRER